jgi:hypothetical protein
MAFGAPASILPLQSLFLVMAGLVPASHVFFCSAAKAWMPGTRPGMTILD